MKKNSLVMILLVAFSVTSCETLSKVGKGTMIGGLTGCLTGLLAGAAYDEAIKKKASGGDIKDVVKSAFGKKKKASNKGKAVGLAAGCAIGLGVGLYFDLMKDDIKEDLESKKIGVAEVKGADGDIEALSLKMGEQAVKFNPGKADVPDSGKATLDKVADSIKAYPDTKVNISGHTDASGDPAFNKTLSQQRADSVKGYLKSQGITDDQIGETKGVGADKPAPGASPNDPANRRVELAITAG
ncbi:MAG: OmpA family protein [Leptospiraceae bacterium]|jgi:outer membrane protein OmpA-like peptidoglycan-associated protein/predicted small secreted protein|nr:OmpA family protein [Leptospiraceae bacterium]MBP7190651.1 OmpA family protein [Rickettsiaceae bacterium]MBK7053605.1 OmpA family protein [Leptospiraceae bacterium]MBK9500270.1 OmpA family protein [Leptospiraceae bacterium]MBL0263195.1 OmpA family protein [Leptospiraceae bacterium]